jgi:hypothetical protein
MTKKTKSEKGFWSGFADARGIDAKYAEVGAQAEKELRDTEAGPHRTLPISRDDTEMKNPGGEFQNPSSSNPAPGHHTGSKSLDTDAQGRQGRAPQTK